MPLLTFLRFRHLQTYMEEIARHGEGLRPYAKQIGYEYTTSFAYRHLFLHKFNTVFKTRLQNTLYIIYCQECNKVFFENQVKNQNQFKLQTLLYNNELIPDSIKFMISDFGNRKDLKIRTNLLKNTLELVKIVYVPFVVTFCLWLDAVENLPTCSEYL